MPFIFAFLFSSIFFLLLCSYVSLTVVVSTLLVLLSTLLGDFSTLLVIEIRFWVHQIYFNQGPVGLVESGSVHEALAL